MCRSTDGAGPSLGAFKFSFRRLDALLWLFRPSQHRLQKRPRITPLRLHNLLRRAGRHPRVIPGSSPGTGARGQAFSGGRSPRTATSHPLLRPLCLAMRASMRGPIVAVMECEDKIRPTRSLQRAVRSALALDGPADPQQRRQARGSPLRPASGSCQLEHTGDILRKRLAVLDALGDHPKRERCRLGARFYVRRPVTQDARQGRHLCQPAAITPRVRFQCAAWAIR